MTRTHKPGIFYLTGLIRPQFIEGGTLLPESPNPQITILLPCYNEEEALGPLIDEIRFVMAQTLYEYEILIVDDASTDNSTKVAEEKNVRLIKRTVNGGSGASRRTGIRASNGEVIVMMDADGSYRPEDIPRMLELFPDYSQVNGARTCEKGTLPFLRIPAKWFIRKLASYLVGRPIPDLNTGLKAFKKKDMMRFLWIIPDGFSCVTTMTLVFMANDLPVAYVPAGYRERVGKSKFHPVKDTVNYVLTVIRMIMYFNPLKIFLPVSLILFLIGIIKTLYDWFYVVHYMQASDIVILMTSIILGGFGLIADQFTALFRALGFPRE